MNTRRPLVTSRQLSLFTVVSMLAGTTGCAAIGDIFKAGVWVGAVVVGGLVLLLVGGLTLFSKR